MNTTRRYKTSAGMTLVEVMVATAVLALIVAGVMLSFGSGFNAMSRVRHNQRATQILLEKLETIRLYSWDQVNRSGFIPAEFTDVYDPQGAAGSQGCTFYGTVAIGDFPRATSYKNNMRQLTLTVRWSQDGLERIRTIRTFIAKNGLQNYVY